VYFSGFRPVRGTPLANRPGVNPTREVRLYQAAFLLRDYDFDFEELAFSENGNLSLDVDPKQAWAQSHLKEQPVEINKAEFHELIRVPGIGPITAKRIISQRKNGTIKSLGILRKMGASIQRAAPYLLINGRQSPEQLSLLSLF
jgi:predicted DNA-binding helix-hairpin-helix protein